VKHLIQPARVLDEQIPALRGVFPLEFVERQAEDVSRIHRAGLLSVESESGPRHKGRCNGKCKSESEWGHAHSVICLDLISSRCAAPMAALYHLAVGVGGRRFSVFLCGNGIE